MADRAEGRTLPGTPSWLQTAGVLICSNSVVSVLKNQPSILTPRTTLALLPSVLVLYLRLSPDTAECLVSVRGDTTPFPLIKEHATVILAKRC